MSGNKDALLELFQKCSTAEEKRALANLVMTGGARPLHMCGMSRGGDASSLIQILIDSGANVNAMDNYDMTPLDRLYSNNVQGSKILMENGAKLSKNILSAEGSDGGAPNWEEEKYSYLTGLGEIPNF
jgi:hypothetical protein